MSRPPREPGAPGVPGAPVSDDEAPRTRPPTVLRRHWERIDRLWGQIDSEWGLLTAEQVTQRTGTPATLHLLLGVERVGPEGEPEPRYPAFQLDTEGRVRPVVLHVADIFRREGWTDPAILLWLATPTGQLPRGQRPVDLLDTDPDRVLDAAEQTAPPYDG